jgi:hypothetical protein
MKSGGGFLGCSPDEIRGARAALHGCSRIPLRAIARGRKRPKIKAGYKMN